MIFKGNLIKMKTELANPVTYTLDLSGEEIRMNELIGKKMGIRFQHKIHCIKCGRETKTSFAQGYCYPCFVSAPETEDCVLRPELCKAHEGIARDMDFAEKHCLIEHYVYLAVSSGLKVGVTRNTQIPTRWIDQGASKAIILASTPNRYLAGSIEVALKEFFNDKTNWRNMLTNKIPSNIDLVEEKNKAINYLHKDFQQYAYPKNSVTTINYPVSKYPLKVKSLSLEKNPVISEILSGIKGQYLIFDSGAVMNVRKHNGYLVEIGE
jgi:Protein of unknown function (DUF2797)